MLRCEQEVNSTVCNNLDVFLNDLMIIYTYYICI